MRRSETSPHRAATRARRLTHFDRRIAVGFGTLVLFLMIIVSIAAASTYQRIARVNEDLLVGALTGVLADSINRASFSGRYHTRLLLEEISAAQPQLAYVYVASPEGAIVAHSNPELNATPLPPHVAEAAPTVLATGTPAVRDRHEDGSPVREVVMPYRAGFQNQISGVIVAGVALRSVAAPAAGAWLFLAGLIAALTVLTLLATYLMSKRFAGPVTQLASIFDGILERSPVYIGIFRPDGTLEQASANLRHLAETPEESIEVTPANQPLFRDRGKRADVFEWPYRRAGRDRIAMATSFPVAMSRDGEPTFFCAIAADITAQRDAEAALREHRDLLELTVQQRTRALEEANTALSLREFRATRLGRLKATLLGDAAFPEKMKQIAACTVELLDLDDCSIWRAGPADRCDHDCEHGGCLHQMETNCSGTQCLHLVAARSRDGDRRAGSPERIPFGFQRVGKLAQGNQMRDISNNLSEEATEGGRGDLVSFAGFRLVSARGELAGIFAAFGTSPIEAEDEAVLDELATTASYVIQAKLAADELGEANRILIQRERLATLGELTATVSHELRNPLGTIQASFYLLKTRLAQMQDEKISSALERAARGITRCDRIIEALLDFTREPALHTEITQLDTWLAAEVEAYPFPDGITVRLDIQPQLRAGVDRQLLFQCLTNILNNACDAITEERTTEGDKPREIRIGLAADDKELTLTVEDTGMGIPRENLELVFKPLFSTKGFGTGLGLPLVRKLLDLHGGRIEITSQFGQGTVVRLLIPRELTLAGTLPRAAS